MFPSSRAQAGNAALSTVLPKSPPSTPTKSEKIESNNGNIGKSLSEVKSQVNNLNLEEHKKDTVKALEIVTTASSMSASQSNNVPALEKDFTYSDGSYGGLDDFTVDDNMFTSPPPTQNVSASSPLKVLH